MRNANPGGRPAKYASDEERKAAARARQAKYRSRYSVISTRFRDDTAETLERISAVTLLPVSELVHQMVQFALANRNWYTDPSFVKRVTTQSYDDRRRATKHQPSEDDE